MHPLDSIEHLLAWTATGAAVISAAILIWYLAARPALGRPTKILLLVGLGALPVVVAITGNIAGFEHTTTRAFCSSCHVMGAYVRDAADPKSQSLAAIHSRNAKFGGESCYVCHSDYSVFGALTTKALGLRHVWNYATVYAATGPDGEGGPPIKLASPFPVSTCRQCHSLKAPKFSETHADALAPLEAGDATCIDCHSEVHPTALAHRSPQPPGSQAK